MKKVILLLVAGILLLLPVCAQAGEQAGEVQPQAESGGTSTDLPQMESEVLAIDNQNIYAGMDKAYKDGYTPVFSDQGAKIVLPLILVDTSEQLQKNEIHVSFDLGDTQTSPFQFKNYDLNVGLANNLQTNNGTKSAFLISQTFSLSARRIMGRYPLVVNVDGKRGDGTAFNQSFTVYVTITDGIDPDATPPPDQEPTDTGGGGSGEEAPIPEVKILLADYSINPSPAIAGEEVSISATIFNTSETQDITNVKITVAGETTDLLPVGKTNSFYFKTIPKQGSEKLGFKMLVSQNAKAEPQKLVLTIEYEGKKASPYDAQETILIPVTQNIRLEFDEPQIPAIVNAGNTIQVSVNVMNMGLGTVHNARMELEAPGLLPEKTAFMGNILSGESKKGDMYVFVGTIDMSEGRDTVEKYGPTSGTVTLTYEDEHGQEFIEEFPFDTQIKPPEITANTEDEEEEKPKNEGQWWVSIIVAAAIIAAILSIRHFVKQRQQKQREEDEAD